MNGQDGEYSVGRTNITSVGGEKWHSGCDVTVVVVELFGAPTVSIAGHTAPRSLGVTTLFLLVNHTLL